MAGWRDELTARAWWLRAVYSLLFAAWLGLVALIVVKLVQAA